MEKSSVYYLSAESNSSDSFLLFRAYFSEACDIKSVFIVASSLHHAIFILYDKLCPLWGKGYLDNHLLELKFYDKYAVY